MSMKNIIEYINNDQINESIFDNNIDKNDKISLTIQALTQKWAKYKPNKTDGSKDAFGNPMKPGDILLVMGYSGYDYNPDHKQVFDLGVYICNDGRLTIYQSITGTDLVSDDPLNRYSGHNEIDIYSLYKIAEKNPKKFWYDIPQYKDANFAVMFGKMTPNKIINLSAIGMNINNF